MTADNRDPTKRIGSGRHHGERPGRDAAPQEHTLYDATHSDTAWIDPEPEPEPVAALIRWYRTLPGCALGGSLHIVIEDFNCDDSHLERCIGYADGVGDTCGSELAGLLRWMDAYDRVHAVDLAADTTEGGSHDRR